MAEVETTSWVQCDQCEKWRKVDAQYAADLEEDGAWTCTDNPDTTHASCDIPQEATEGEVRVDENDVDPEDPDEPEPEPDAEDDWDPADDE